MTFHNRRLRASLLFGVFIAVVYVLAACRPATRDDRADAESQSRGATTFVETDATVAPDARDEQPAADQNAPLQAAELLQVDLDSLATDENGVAMGFTTSGHAFRGDPNAPVVILEYSDYQCPFCARFVSETLPSLLETQIAAGDAVLVYYDFPLNSIHPQAELAAAAARCAGEEGAPAYWAMHDALFAAPGEWANDQAAVTFAGYASEIGLDGNAFRTCLVDGRYEEAIQADLASGAAAGVTGTPTFFFNGQVLVGALPVNIFDTAITTVKEGGQLATNEPSTTPSQPAAVPTPATINSDFAGAMGDPDAPVTIVEYTDYQCPYCSRHSSDTMPQIFQEMVESGQVFYVLKDFPLDQLHPEARRAAAAARCGGDQDAYWEMHDAIFAGQETWAGQGEAAGAVFSGYAADLGLDAAAFSECLASGRHDAAVEANLQEGTALGVSGTPYFFINGYPLNGARPYEHFEIAVSLAEEGRLSEIYAPQPEAQPQQQQPAGRQDVDISGAHSLGDEAAPITIVEFTDFQCPYCSRHFQQTFPQILEQYVETGVVRYVFMDFPLNSIHPQAAKAAEAARCAGDQGAYSAMHDLLFERQSAWSNNRATATFTSMADELGLDEALFSQCLSSGKYNAAVEADLQQGIRLGVTGTPAFFLNGYPLSGAQPFSVFEQAIAQLQAGQTGGGES